MIAPIVRCLVVAADPAVGAEVAALADDLPGVQLVGVVAPLRAVAGRLPPSDVALVADPGDGGAPGLRQLVAGCERPVVVLARSADVETYRRALGAGARAVLPLPTVPSALGDALIDAAVAASPAGAAAAGRVFTVVAAKGGTGATSVALALALLGDALLVDLAGARASLAALLGCRAERSLVDLAHVGEGLAAAIATAAVEHPAGLRLVPGASAPEIAATLPGGFGSALVRELRATTPAVVDAGQGVFAASREAAVAADRTMVVVTPDAYAAAAGRELVTTLVRSGASIDAITVVVNRWSRRSELSLRGIARTVGAPVAAAIATDPGSMDAFANGHARLDGWPGRSFSGALRALVTELAA